jgi:SAM-dependent methyltransferase
VEATQEIFERIYRYGLWGGRKRFWRRFYSGTGSFDQKIIRPYVEAVLPLISGKRVVDIGCGDFTVGKHLIDSAKHYDACDIARPLINYNRRKFRSYGLEFHSLDAVNEPLPNGGVVLLRQVLQHLSNKSVASVLSKIQKYPIAIITDNVPRFPFEPNVDIPTGVGDRTAKMSGLVLTAAPFNLHAKTSRLICEVEWQGGTIQTHVYEFDC